MKFPHLLESYQEQVSDLPMLAADLGEDHPRLSWSKASAEETLASYYMANADDRYREHLRAGLRHQIDWWQRGDVGLGAWNFILYTCVAVSLDDMDSLRQLLGMAVEAEGYARVTVEWYGLHRAILVGQEYSPKRAKKTKGEERIFKALGDISIGQEPDWSDFDAYWKSTRNRSHEFTILQHRDLLKDGMLNLWSIRHDTQQDARADALARATQL